MSRKLRGNQGVSCLDVNNLSLRPVTIVEARRLVLDGAAVPCTSTGGELPGWEGRAWRDWPSVKMVRPSKVEQTACSLTENDCHLVAGERGNNKAAKRAKQRLHSWPGEHDTFAPTIHAGKAFIPSQQVIRARAEQRRIESLSLRHAEQQQANQRLRAAEWRKRLFPGMAQGRTQG